MISAIPTLHPTISQLLPLKEGEELCLPFAEVLAGRFAMGRQSIKAALPTGKLRSLMKASGQDTDSTLHRSLYACLLDCQNRNGAKHLAG